MNIQNQFKTYTETEKQAFTFTWMNEDCMVNILRLLPIRSLLSFEQVEKGTSGDMTSRVWEEICARKRFNFDWSDLDKYPECSKDKMRYLMGQALFTVFKIHQKRRSSFFKSLMMGSPRNSLDQGVQQYLNFFPSSLMQFSSLKAYIIKDIKESAPIPKLERQVLPLNERDLRAGDQLLVGLGHLSTYLSSYTSVNIATNMTLSLKKAKAYLTQAIQNQATGASLLAVRLFEKTHGFFEQDIVLNKLLFEVAQLSITENGAKDYRGLHDYLHQKCLSVTSLQELLNRCLKEKNCSPPIFEYMALNLGFERNFPLAKVYFDVAKVTYGPHILPQTWENLFHFTYDLGLRMRKGNQIESFEAYKADALLYKTNAIAAWEEDEEAVYSFLKEIIDKHYLFHTRNEQEQLTKELMTFSIFPNKKKQFQKEWKIKVKDDLLLSYLYLQALLSTFEEKEIPIKLLLLQAYVEGCFSEYPDSLDYAIEVFNRAINISQNRGVGPTVESLYVEAALKYKSDKLEEAKICLDQVKAMLEKEERDTYFELFSKEWMEGEIIDREQAIEEALQEDEQMNSHMDISGDKHL